jgi:hypothetical protein
MKQWQYITIFSLILALAGPSPVVVADAGGPATAEPTQQPQSHVTGTRGYKLLLAALESMRARGSVRRF